MIKHSLKYLLRVLSKNGFYSLSILTGFCAVMITCTFIIMFYTHETNADRFHRNHHRIYRLLMENPVFDRLSFATVPETAIALQTQYPEVESVTFVQSIGVIKLLINQHPINESKALLVDTAFLKIFDFEIEAGNRTKCLTRPNAVVITKSFAKEHFKQSNPIGQVIQWNSYPLEVTAIMKDPPGSSHLQFALLISSLTLHEPYRGVGNATYILLTEKSSVATLGTKLKANASNLSAQFGKELNFELQSLDQAYFHEADFIYDFAGEIFRHRDRNSLYIFITIAITLLSVAIFNFVTFSQAKAASRSKDISIIRIFGASRLQNFTLFLLEACLFIIPSAILSLIVVAILLPRLNFLTNSLIDLNYFINWKAALSISFLIVVSIFVLAFVNYTIFLRIKTSELLKGMRVNGNIKLIYILSLFQFGTSLVLTYLTISMFRQIEYMNTRPLGFNKERLIGIMLSGVESNVNFQMVKEEFKKLPGVVSTSLCSGNPFNGRGFYSDIKNGISTPVSTLIGDADYLHTVGFELLDGRWFNPNLRSDSMSIVINATAAKVFSLDIDSLYGGIQRVIGITHDFNYASFREPIGPVIIYYRPYNRHYQSDAVLMLRIERPFSEVYNSLRRKWSQLFPMVPFDSELVEDKYESLNSYDTKQALLIGYCSITTILITIFGLSGVSYFIAKQKLKNFVIRRVHGATPKQLIFKTLQSLVMLMIFSSIPIYAISQRINNNWFSNFAYKVDAPFWIFALMIGTSLVVIITTVFIPMHKSINANPADILRYE